MTSTDRNRAPVGGEPQRPAVAQLRLFAGSLARRSVGPTLMLVAVIAAMVIAANAPATLAVMVPVAIGYRRLRRRRLRR